MVKYTRFQDVPQFTRGAVYHVDVGWDYLALHYYRYIEHYNMDVNPKFQRGHVWTEQQKVRYIEFILQGGKTGRDIYVNCPNWNSSSDMPKWCVLVDGKQRLDAVFGFLNNEFKAFDSYFSEYTGAMRMTHIGFHWYVNDLKTIEEVYQWYIDLNTGGTVHTEEEVAKVKDMLARKEPYELPPKDTRYQDARVSRGVIQDALAKEREREAKQAEERRARDAEEAKKPKGRKKK